MTTARPARRAVVIVPNPSAPYSRGLRVARSLAAEGWEVEIAAQEAGSLPVEEHDGHVLVRRYGRSGPWVRKLARRPGPPGVGRRIVMKAYRILARRWAWARRHPPPTSQDVRNKLLWPTQDRPWWHTLAQDLAPADLYHACGYRAIPVALELAAAARRHGRAGRVIYDAIDIALETNTFISRHRAWKWLYQRRERAWARRADALVAANDALATDLVRRLGLPRPPIVLLNTLPLATIPSARPDRIRSALGLPADQRVVVYLGRLAPHRGLEEAAEAVLRVDRAVLVLIGFGVLEAEEQARSTRARFAGRHFTLPPVHPDEVPGWAASADASLVALPPVSLNQRLSTPNKLWESLAGGTPVVVGRETTVMRDLVERLRLGAVVDPLDPEDIARGLRSILDAPPAEHDALRDRCLEAARERFNWEATVAPYLDLVRRLDDA